MEANCRAITFKHKTKNIGLAAAVMVITALLAGCAAPSVPRSISTHSGMPGTRIVSAQEYPELVKPLWRVAPVYPRRAQVSGLTGCTITEFSIDANGAVYGATARTMSASTDMLTRDEFSQASLRALDGFVYQAPLLNGEPVEVSGLDNVFTYVVAGTASLPGDCEKELAHSVARWAQSSADSISKADKVKLPATTSTGDVAKASPLNNSGSETATTENNRMSHPTSADPWANAEFHGIKPSREVINDFCADASTLSDPTKEDIAEIAQYLGIQGNSDAMHLLSDSVNRARFAVANAESTAAFNQMFQGHKGSNAVTPDFEKACRRLVRQAISQHYK